MKLDDRTLGMYNDIRTATTREELRSLASLESEYPLVFVPELKYLINERLTNFVGRVTRKYNLTKCIPGRPRGTSNKTT